jgi:outer membrane biosynthesis protein TonB
MTRIAAYTLSILLVGEIPLFAQTTFQYPSPVIGWDSLKALMHYPLIMNRANIEGVANVELEIDSTGAITVLKVESNAELFKTVVQTAIQNTKWHPAIMTNGRPTEYYYNFPVHFFLRKKVNLRITIEEDKAPPDWIIN